MKLIVAAFAMYTLLSNVHGIEKNLYDNPGFESWDKKNDLPSATTWRWKVTPEIRKQFEIFALSSQEKHSGKSSLHLKDNCKENINNELTFIITGKEAKALGGKILRFSAWVKQVSASHPKNTGIGLYIQTEKGDKQFSKIAIDSNLTTDWQELKTKILLPEDCTLILASLNCANGWRNTGEAYFDDVILTTDPIANHDHTNVTQITPVNNRHDETLTPKTEYAKSYLAPIEYTEDDAKRPEIKNGTWYMDGKPQYYLGPWIYNRKHVDWNSNANPLKIDHIAYKTGPNKKVFDFMGFNSAQISAAYTLPGQVLYGMPTPPDVLKFETNAAEFLSGFEKLPMVLDFAFGFHHEIKKKEPEKYKEMEQRNGKWHEFIPLCPEHPDGNRYYEAYMIGGTHIALKNKTNVYVYELFNESAYNCQCRFNARDFANRMQIKYDNISNANKIWGTIFDSFDEVAAITSFQQYKKLWPDWCKFSSQRYAELLCKYTAVIRNIDKRSNVYFTEQAAGTPPANPGMDYRLIAKSLDVLAIEGGWRYGFASDPKAKNEMEAVVMTGGSAHWFNCDFYQALSKGKKPIMNDEHYCTRIENDIRVPSRKEDMITSLWSEILHGVSSNYTYVWDKRSFDWKTFEEAKKNVIKPSYKSSSMLNPYNWPISELIAFKMFEKELGPYKDQILPFPRTKPATVAVFYSYPTMRMTPFINYKYGKRMENWYAALLHSQFPVKIVFEEELASGLDKNVESLIFPAADYITPETLTHVEAFRRRGGLVIAEKNAFAMDEYGNTLTHQRTDIVRIDANHAEAQIKLVETLLNHKIKRYGTIDPADTTTPITQTDLQIIDRGDFKLIYLVAMGDMCSRLANVKLLLDDQGEFYLTDIINHQIITHNNSEKWTMNDLRQGVKIILPSQQRVVLSLERKRPAGTSSLSQEDILQAFQQIHNTEIPQIDNFRMKREQLRNDYINNRIYRDVTTEKCHSIDLRNFVNMHFKDEVAGNKKGGWFDQGGNDFANIPLGKQTFAGVPFEIINPDTNNGKGVIILYGTNRDYFPRKITNIPVNLKAKVIYFLHTMGWNTQGKILSYQINYADGSTVEIPINYGQEIGTWWGAEPLPKAKIAVESSNAEKDLINMQCFRWVNPNQQKEINNINIISAQNGGVPAVAAITVEQP